MVFVDFGVSRKFSFARLAGEVGGSDDVDACGLVVLGGLVFCHTLPYMAEVMRGSLLPAGAQIVY